MWVGVLIGKLMNSLKCGSIQQTGKVNLEASWLFFLLCIYWIDETCASSRSSDLRSRIPSPEGRKLEMLTSCALSSRLHYPSFTQRMRHFQCLRLVWSNFYLKCWGTVSRRASRVEEKGEFTPEGSMEQKCPRGKTSTWITIFCCIVTVQNVTIGCSCLLLFISVESTWIISKFLELSWS